MISPSGAASVTLQQRSEEDSQPKWWVRALKVSGYVLAVLVGYAALLIGVMGLTSSLQMVQASWFATAIGGALILTLAIVSIRAYLGKRTSSVQIAELQQKLKSSEQDQKNGNQKLVKSVQDNIQLKQTVEEVSKELTKANLTIAVQHNHQDGMIAEINDLRSRGVIIIKELEAAKTEVDRLKKELANKK